MRSADFVTRETPDLRLTNYQITIKQRASLVQNSQTLGVIFQLISITYDAINIAINIDNDRQRSIVHQLTLVSVIIVILVCY